MNNEIDLSRALRVAEGAAVRVGEQIAAAIFCARENEISYKSAIDIVTDLDVWSEKEISETLLKEFPGTTLIGEESSRALEQQSGRSIKELSAEGIVWAIDPIDGTNNFSNHIPHVAISIGLLINGERKMGVAYDPVRKELFSAIKGSGATLNGEKISPSTNTEVNRSIIGISFPVDRCGRWDWYWKSLEPVVLEARTARVLGSGVLNFCWIADGRLDGIVEHNLKLWDIAAASLIAEEAGCKLANADSVEDSIVKLDLFKSSFVASGPGLFNELMELVLVPRKLS